MKLLLDTHTFIWWDGASDKLSSQVLALCQDEENEMILSVASVWEMQIKLQVGKLKLRLALAEIIKGQQERNNLQILPISLVHTLALSNLPLHHKDPFDRLLIAQANVEGAILVSRDRAFAQYSVETLW